MVSASHRICELMEEWEQWERHKAQKFQEFEDKDGAENERRSQYDLEKRTVREEYMGKINCKLAALYTEMAALKDQIVSNSVSTGRTSLRDDSDSKVAAADSANKPLSSNGSEIAIHNGSELAIRNGSNSVTRNGSELVTRNGSTGRSTEGGPPEVHTPDVSPLNMFTTPSGPATYGSVVSLPGHPCIVRRRDGTWVELRCPICGTNRGKVTWKTFNNWNVFWDHLNACHGEKIPGSEDEKAHNTVKRCSYRIVDAEEVARLSDQSTKPKRSGGNFATTSSGVSRNREDASLSFPARQPSSGKRPPDDLDQSPNKRARPVSENGASELGSNAQQLTIPRAEMPAMVKGLAPVARLNEMSLEFPTREMRRDLVARALGTKVAWGHQLVGNKEKYACETVCYLNPNLNPQAPMAPGEHGACLELRSLFTRYSESERFPVFVKTTTAILLYVGHYKEKGTQLVPFTALDKYVPRLVRNSWAVLLHGQNEIGNMALLDTIFTDEFRVREGRIPQTPDRILRLMEEAHPTNPGTRIPFRIRSLECIGFDHVFYNKLNEDLKAISTSTDVAAPRR